MTRESGPTPPRAKRAKKGPKPRPQPADASGPTGAKKKARPDPRRPGQQPRAPSGRSAPGPGRPGAGGPGPDRREKKHEKTRPAPRPSSEATPQTALDAAPRAGTVALFGRPNVGKSTFLNAALAHPLAIVSSTPQTTRDVLLGVVHHRGAELGVLDTPGLHKPRTELGRVMNESAREAARGADVILFMADASAVRPLGAARGEEAAGEEAGEPFESTAVASTSGEEAPKVALHPGDLALLSDLPEGVPVVLVLNKIDRLKTRDALLPVIDAFRRVREFSAIVPISAKREDGVLRVLDELAALVPEGPFRHEPDTLTDRPVRFFVAEYVREQILRATEAEVPHASAVTIERFVEPAGGGAIHIDATIHVERAGQKKILVGRGAEMLKAIGTRARQRIEAMTERPVYLKLWVRTTPKWRESPRQLEELGYGKLRREGA